MSENRKNRKNTRPWNDKSMTWKRHLPTTLSLKISSNIPPNRTDGPPLQIPMWRNVTPRNLPHSNHRFDTRITRPTAMAAAQRPLEHRPFEPRMHHQALRLGRPLLRVLTTRTVSIEKESDIDPVVTVLFEKIKDMPVCLPWGLTNRDRFECDLEPPTLFIPRRDPATCTWTRLLLHRIRINAAVRWTTTLWTS